MKTKIILSSMLLFCSIAYVQAQLINAGATIVIESDATLFVEGEIVNQGSGVITNSGTIEVQGNLNNLSTITSNPNSIVIFSGADDATVTSGGAVLANVEMRKTGKDIILADNMSISKDLNFVNDNNLVVIGNHDLILADDATITSPDDNEYVATTGTGMVQKSVTADGTFIFPVGDASNYSPVTSVYTGTSYSSAKIRVNANNVVHPKKPVNATDYINRYWDVDATGITSYSNVLTGTYDPGDDVGSPTLIKGAIYNGAEWNYDGSLGAANSVTATTTDDSADLTGTNLFGKLDIKVFLQGAYSGGMMSTALNTAGLIPLTSPYAADPVTVDPIPADVVDWVLIELRDPTTPTIVLSSHAAFLKNDGEILSLGGADNPLLKEAAASVKVVIKHRNHLGAMKDVAVSTTAVTPEVVNMKDGVSIFGTDAMKDLGGGVYAMRSGDANNNARVTYSGFSNDLSTIYSVLGGNLSLLNTYNKADLNLNGRVTYSGFSNDLSTLYSSLGGALSLLQQLP